MVPAPGHSRTTLVHLVLSTLWMVHPNFGRRRPAGSHAAVTDPVMQSPNLSGSRNEQETSAPLIVRGRACPGGGCGVGKVVPGG